MQVLIDIPEDVVVTLLTNPNMTGDISKRILQGLRHVLPPSSVLLTRQEVFNKISCRVLDTPAGETFDLRALVESYTLSDGDKRQIFKELRSKFSFWRLDVLIDDQKVLLCRKED